MAAIPDNGKPISVYSSKLASLLNKLFTLLLRLIKNCRLTARAQRRRTKPKAQTPMQTVILATNNSGAAIDAALNAISGNSATPLNKILDYYELAFIRSEPPLVATRDEARMILGTGLETEAEAASCTL